MEVSTVDKYILKEYFAINLKWYRFNKNYTQEKLAELSNLTAKYISDLERGKYSPSLNKIEDLARALEIEPYLLLKPKDLENNSCEISGRIDQKIGRNRKGKNI